VNWNELAVPDRFAIVVTLDEEALPNPAAFGTDHPSAGPTGPQACGLCYSADRTNRSFMYGTPASPLCPGVPFFDYVCDAQLFWSALMVCDDPPLSTEPSTWGQIKNLYR
jgi:hypothetical protein